MTWYLPQWDETTTFLHAVASGDLPKVREMVDLGVSIETLNPSEGETPVLLAARSKKPGLVDFLLDRGADARARNKYAESLLHFLAAHPETVGLIGKAMACGADPEARNAWGATPILTAAGSACVTGVRRLLDRGADAFACDQDGSNPDDFFSRVALDQTGRVSEMLAAQPDLANATLQMEGGRNCALAAAIDHAGESMIRLLLDAGADPNGPARHWSSLVHAAVDRGLPVDLVRRLIEEGAPADRGDGDGNTPLNLAARRGDVEIAKLLLDHGAHVNSTTERGYTPLMFARTDGMRSFLKSRGGRDL